MTTASSTAVAKTYVYCREAARLLRGPQGEVLGSDVRVMIAALQLRSLALIRNSSIIPTITHPTTIAGCLDLAAAQTPEWDLSRLPPEAVDFIIDLIDLRHATAGVRRP